MSVGSRVNRGERILSRLVADGLISEQGKDWATCALDPFHDHQLKNLAGWPDVQGGASVVRIVKQSVTVQVPAGVVGNWDLHIVQWPWLTSNQNATASGNYTISTSRSGQVISTSTTTANARVGGLQGYYVPTGTPLGITLVPGGTQLVFTLDVPQIYLKGVTRLIGCGFEVHNTTSQLNVQGSVIGYRQMANENSKTGWNVLYPATVPASESSYSGPFIRYPPRDSKEAMLLSGSRQWEAKDGIYSVSAFHTTENPAVLVSPTAPVISGAGTDDNEGTLATSIVNVQIPDLGAGLTNRGVTGFRVHNIHQNGCIFQGLSNSTTLTINWNVFLETFPSATDLETLPLATPSAEFDPDVLDLYSRVITDLPVAVPVSENGLGDWFYDAAVTAAKYLGPIMSMAPHPIIKAAGTFATGLATAAGAKPAKTAGTTAVKWPAMKNSMTPPNAWGNPPMVSNKKAKKVLNASSLNWENRSGMPRDRGSVSFKNSKRNKGQKTRVRRRRAFSQ